MKRTICALLFALLMLPLCSYACAEDSTNGYMYQYSTTIEKEKPELDEVTKELIAAYRQDPTQENYDRLREQVGINYDKVLAKKQAKLEELKATARDQSKIDEMQVIVDEMIRDRENRIDQTMSRFTDERLRPGSSTGVDGYVPVMGFMRRRSQTRNTPYSSARQAIGRRPAGQTAAIKKARRTFLSSTFPLPTPRPTARG